MDRKSQTSTMPKWFSAKDLLRKSLLHGEFGAMGSPFPQVRDVAKRCDISLVTAQKVVKLLHEEGLIVRNGKGYVVKAGVASKASRQRIGVLLTMPNNPFFSLLAQYIEEAATRRGFGTVLAYSSYDVARERDLIEMFEEDGVAGLLISPAEGKLSAGNLRACKLPHILLGRKVEDYEADAVLVQNFSAGQAVARHLVSRKLKSFAYLGFKKFPCDPRLQGFRAGLAEAGLSLPDTSILYADNAPVNALFPDLRRLLTSLETPLGLFCFHDILAARALRAATGVGLNVPRDLSLVGFDNLPISSEMVPSLSSVAYPIEQIAELALSSLLRRVEGDRNPVQVNYLEPSLVIRESSGGCAPEVVSINEKAMACCLA